MICRACKKDHNQMLTCGRAARMAGQQTPPVNTTAPSVNTTPTKPRSADRHKPGYMAEFMRKDRAKRKAAKG